MDRRQFLVAGLLGAPGALSLSCLQSRPGPEGSFSRNYREAREAFLAAARAAGAELDRHDHPLRGPQWDELSTDVALIGPPAATRVLVVISGTHGVEGFCGSAVQTALLRDGLSRSLPEGARVVLIHAMNPYGFAWLRRFDEDNVDLNRNFIDHDQPPANRGYDVLADAVEEETLDMERIVAIAEERGVENFRAALTRGQYDHPQGVFYGGRKPAWSNRTLRAIIEKHLVGARHVALVDIHTGLGRHGDAECISNERVESEAFQRARAWWGELARSSFGDSISPPVTGSLKWGFARMVPGAEVTAVSLEFGTSPPTEVFGALHAEVWAHHHLALDDPRTAAAKTELRRVFHPDTDAWNESACVRAEEVIRAGLEGLVTS